MNEKKDAEIRSEGQVTGKDTNEIEASTGESLKEMDEILEDAGL